MLTQDEVVHLLQLVDTAKTLHCHPEQLLPQLQAIRNCNPSQVRIEKIGQSRDGRNLYAVLIGDTEKNPIIAATGNCHAEEAIGTTTILKLAEAIASKPELQPVLENYSFAFIPQANPDGTLKNWEWLKIEHPSYRDYLQHYYRDNRSEDVEHGIPTPETAQECRPEPEAIAKFYRRFPKISYYVTLHSYNITSDVTSGAMFLVSDENNPKLPPVCDIISTLTREQGYSLSEDNTNGMNGFEFFRPGYYAIPRFEVMRTKMLIGGDPERIKKFKLNSFQLVETECQCSLSLVSELPYFEVRGLEDLTPLADHIPVACDREILKRKLVDIEEQSAKQRMNLLACLSASNFSSPLMEFYWEKTKWLLGNIAGDRQDCQKVRGYPALMKDLLEVRIRPLMLEAEVAAMMLRLYYESGDESYQVQSAISYYDQQFTNACAQIDRITEIKTVPLADQVKIQAGIILSGLLVAEGNTNL